jgi:hypothetical protein
MLRILLIWLLLQPLSGCHKETADQDVFIENGKIKLGFNKQSGSLSCLIDLLNSYNWLEGYTDTGSPWAIEFLQPGGIETIDIKSAEKFRYAQPDPETLILRWKRFAGAGNRNLEVTATVSLEHGKALSMWKISVDNIRSKAIKQVIFPRIEGLRDPGEEYLAVPQWMGHIMKDPRKHLAEIQGKERRGRVFAESCKGKKPGIEVSPVWKVLKKPGY